MTCEHFEHKLVERAEGLLDPRGAAELDAHLASCESCRHAERAVGDLGRRLDAAGAAFGAATLAVPAPTSRHAGAQRRSEAERTHRRPRRALRWAAPLAGVAALAGVLIVPLVMDRTAGGANASISLAAMGRALDTSRSCACDVRFIPDDGPEQVGRITVVDSHAVRVDMPDGRVIITDTRTGRTQIRLPSEQKFIEAPAREQDPIDLYQRLVSLADNPSEDRGVEVIDGVTARVFLVRNVEGPLDPDEYTVWVNPHTSLPMRVVMPGRLGVIGRSAGPAGRIVLDNFAFGHSVDPALVAFEPPADFTPAPLRADAKAARMETAVAARNIVTGLVMYRQIHGDWPASLQALVDQGHLTLERIRNPRAASADLPDFGWIYVRPGPDEPADPAALLVVTEPAPEPWSEVVVGFYDGHVEVLSERERYERMLAEARAAR